MTDKFNHKLQRSKKRECEVHVLRSNYTYPQEWLEKDRDLISSLAFSNKIRPSRGQEILCDIWIWRKDMIDAAAAGVSYIFDIPTSINGCQNSFYCAQIKMKIIYQCTTNRVLTVIKIGRDIKYISPLQRQHHFGPSPSRLDGICVNSWIVRGNEV